MSLPNLEGQLPIVKQSSLGYEGKVVNVRVDLLELPGEAQEPVCTLREVAVHAPVVVILADLPDGTLALVRQYRHPVGREILEFPAGKIDEDESPIEAARRELQEEVGLIPAILVESLVLESSPGWAQERVHFFQATGCVQAMFLPADDSEQITVEYYTAQQVFKLIKEGVMISMKDIALFTWIYLDGDAR